MFSFEGGRLKGNRSTTLPPVRRALSPAPLIKAVCVYLFVVSVMLAIVLIRTQGHQIYLLDDSYIHAAIARNLVQHHIYGVSPFQTVFASSSILWPYLIALLYLLIGVHIWVQFALNVVCSVLTLIAADHLFCAIVSERLPPSTLGRVRFALLSTLTLSAPLLSMTFVGMEHILHLAAVLLLLHTYVKMIGDEGFSGRSAVALCGCAAFATSVRYESLFLLLPLCIALLLHRRILLSAATGAAGFVPVICFGLYAKSRGSGFFPGPLSVKTSTNTTFIRTAVRNFTETSSIGGAVTLSFVVGAGLICLALLRRRAEQGNFPLRTEVMAIVLSGFLIHAGLARFGWFFRYEMYLIGLLTVSVFAVGMELLTSSAGEKRWAQGMLLLFAVGLSGRAAGIAYLSPRNAVAIYEQQYQIGQFLSRYYAGHSVALNDIGAPTYLTDLKCLDLFGLASPEVARLGVPTREQLADFSTRYNVEIAILYPSFFNRIVPASWIPVASLTIDNLPGHLFLGDKTVELYATSAALSKRLKEQVRAFSSELPPGVGVTIDSSPSTNNSN